MPTGCNESRIFYGKRVHKPTRKRKKPKNSFFEVSLLCKDNGGATNKLLCRREADTRGGIIAAEGGEGEVGTNLFFKSKKRSNQTGVFFKEKKNTTKRKETDFLFEEKSGELFFA